MLRRSLVSLRLPTEVLRKSGDLPRFDVCVIGGGPGGIAASMRAAQLGKKVCLVEANKLGGTDLWNGTVPSKTLWSIGQYASRLMNPEMLAQVMDPSKAVTPDGLDAARIQAAVQKVSEEKVRYMRDFIKAAGVHLVKGKASFANESEIDVHTEGTGEYRTVQADYFIIATGSKPREHPMFLSDHKRIITSNDIFKLPIPKSMVIIGSGLMGCEFASIYSSLGKTKVALIDKWDRILPKEDEDIALHVQRSLIARGVRIHLHHQLIDLETYESEGREDGACQYTIQSLRDGSVESLIVERALMTIGRVAAYNGLGLENTKMRVRNGVLQVDEFNRCKPYKHIYCVGDSLNEHRIVNVAEAQGRSAIDDIYESKQRSNVKLTDIANLSRVAFYDEELAAIGLNETQCRKQKIGYIVAKYEYSYLTRSMVCHQTNGFVKLLVSNDREKRVLGVRALGSHSASVVEVASLAIRNRSSVYDLLRINGAYPSMVLGLVECARMTVQRGALMANLVEGVSVREWHPEHASVGRAFDNAAEP